MTPPLLDTPRLVLRPFVMEDAEAVFAFGRDPEVVRYTSWHPHQSVADAEAAVQRYLARYEADDAPNWAAVRRDTGALIGAVGFGSWHREHRRAEIGYMLARSAWGQGFMPEILRALLRYGFEEMGLHRVEAMVNVPNEASMRVLEKVGMRREGVLRGYVWKDGEPHDLQVFALLRDEHAVS